MLDTNVLLEDSQAIDSYEKAKVVIPFQVIEELDKHKSAPGILGGNARAAIRALEKASHGTRVLLRQWGQEEQAELESRGMEPSPDNLIIATALAIKGCTLVSNDLAVRLKGSSFGLKVQAHTRDTKTNSISDIYSGLGKMEVSEEAINSLYAVGHMGIPKKMQLPPNQYLHIQSITNEKHTAIGRVVDGQIFRVNAVKECFSIKPKNLSQTIALDSLLDPSLSLVALLGPAGTGKSLICLAAALNQVMDQHRYKKVMLVKSTAVVGDEIGFLPGDLSQKLGPGFESFYDSFDVLFNSEKSSKTKGIVEMMIKDERLEMVPYQFFRGRSMQNVLMVIDEAQNIPADIMKTILTRVAGDSKVVLLGDISQIDNKKLDALNNGLTKVVEVFSGQKCFAQVVLDKCERGPLAELASRLL